MKMLHIQLNWFLTPSLSGKCRLQLGVVCSNVQISPASVYTRMLKSAACYYGDDLDDDSNASLFCPPDQEATPLPYEGLKKWKLNQLSDVFCSSCGQEDTLCQSLFCKPKRLLVTIAISVMTTMCQELNENSDCYNRFCSGLDTDQQEAPASLLTDYNTTATTTLTTTTATTLHDYLNTVPTTQGTPAALSAPAGTASLGVVSHVLCRRLLRDGQYEASEAVCSHHTQDDSPVDQASSTAELVTTFAPSLMCSLMKASGQADTCSKMFCGQDPRVAGVIRQAVCGICQLQGALACISNYCT